MLGLEGKVYSWRRYIYISMHIVITLNNMNFILYEVNYKNRKMRNYSWNTIFKKSKFLSYTKWFNHFFFNAKTPINNDSIYERVKIMKLIKKTQKVIGIALFKTSHTDNLSKGSWNYMLRYRCIYIDRKKTLEKLFKLNVS